MENPRLESLFADTPEIAKPINVQIVKLRMPVLYDCNRSSRDKSISYNDLRQPPRGPIWILVVRNTTPRSVTTGQSCCFVYVCRKAAARMITTG
jgi:hypothetical protein